MRRRFGISLGAAKKLHAASANDFYAQADQLVEYGERNKDCASALLAAQRAFGKISEARIHEVSAGDTAPDGRTTDAGKLAIEKRVTDFVRSTMTQCARSGPRGSADLANERIIAGEGRIVVAREHFLRGDCEGAFADAARARCHYQSAKELLGDDTEIEHVSEVRDAYHRASVGEKSTNRLLHEIVRNCNSGAPLTPEDAMARRDPLLEIDGVQRRKKRRK